jgi:putative PIN family toxin of toxin-antitoxin system
LRVVFDTNVLVSALIRPGRPRQLWKKVLDGEIQLVISKELFLEFEEIIARPKIRKYLKSSILARFRKILLRTAQFTRIRSHADIAIEDADDIAFLEAAYNGRTDFIVSGDIHLLKLKSYSGIKIVTVMEMLELLGN